MKYLFLILCLLSCKLYCIPSAAIEGNECLHSSTVQAKQLPFIFFNPVPARISTGESIELSFSVDTAVVSQYRYMILVPGPRVTSINKTLRRWSQWLKNDFAEIIIPKIEQEGRHTLVIEYKVSGSVEIINFVKSFDVINSNSESVARKDALLEIGDGSKSLETNPEARNTSIINNPDTTLIEALRKRNRNLLIESISDGDSSYYTGQHGDNLFHALNGRLVDDQLIEILVDKKISINGTDNFGNTPLHIAVMSRDEEYVKALTNHGADPDINNNIGLSPLHLAAFLNDSEAARGLLEKGAEVNIRGNSGYTPLHIASMMNNAKVAGYLLRAGAKPGIKTAQKLSSLQIAGIQDNFVVKKIIKAKGLTNLNSVEIAGMGNMTRMDQVKLNPQFDVNLLYNKELLKKRKQAKVAGIISVPVFAVGTAGAVYFRSEANKNYSAYKNADTMEQARQYYDKTLELDMYFYISGGVSLTSLFGIVYSAIKKENITTRMRKTLY